MTIHYRSIVPWGRSYREYVDMFGLSEGDLDRNIVGCGDGPASFNSTMRHMGKRAVSVDPIYQFSAVEIEKRIEETYRDVVEQTRRNRDKFVWGKIRNVEELAGVRMAAMHEFLADYETGKRERRYVHGELPQLPFGDNCFDMALSSHFLFLYTDHLSYEFHEQSVREMLRVAREVRIFPVLDLNANRSSYADTIIAAFTKMGYGVNEVKVDYEFQKNGNTMLKIEINRE